MRASIVALTALVAFVPGAAASAQAAPGPDTVIVERDYADTLQTSRVTLLRRSVYRVELSQPEATPTFMPVRKGVYPPTALLILERGGLGGPVYEVHIDRDGEYDLKVRGLRPGRSVRVRLTTDVGTTQMRQARQDAPGWSIGARGEVGRHSGYLTGAAPDSPEPGMAYSGCLVISNGTFMDLCLGGGMDARGESKTRIAWIFAEIHFKAISLGTRRHLTELGILGRVAQGSAGSDVSRDPSYYGFGVFGQQWIARSPNGRGVSLLASAQYGQLGNITLKDQHTTVIRAGVQWLP